MAMRQFVAVSHTAPLDGSFDLDDLAGGAGRLDVLCRYLTAAFLLSHDIRESVRVWLVIKDEVTIEVRGEELRNLRPDERSTAALLRRALEVADDRAVSGRPVASTPGFYVRRWGLRATIEAVREHGTLVQLALDAPLLTVEMVDGDPIFVLSDHRPFDEGERTLLGELDAEPRSVGPRPLHGNHAIAIAHNLCDRAEATV